MLSLDYYVPDNILFDTYKYFDCCDIYPEVLNGNMIARCDGDICKMLYIIINC